MYLHNRRLPTRIDKTKSVGMVSFDGMVSFVRLALLQVWLFGVVELGLSGWLILLG